MFPNVCVSVGCHYNIQIHWETGWVIWHNWQEFILLHDLSTWYKFGLSIPLTPVGLHCEMYGVWVPLLIFILHFTHIMLTFSIPISKTCTETSWSVSCKVSLDNMFWSRIKSDLEKAACQVYPFQPHVKVVGCIRKQGKYVFREQHKGTSALVFLEIPQTLHTKYCTKPWSSFWTPKAGEAASLLKRNNIS